MADAQVSLSPRPPPAAFFPLSSLKPELVKVTSSTIQGTRLWLALVKTFLFGIATDGELAYAVASMTRIRRSQCGRFSYSSRMYL